MTIMRLSSRKGRSVEEGELGLALGQLLRGLESINLVPVLENVELGRRDVNGGGGYRSASCLASHVM
jgi:hypothetical protein